MTQNLNLMRKAPCDIRKPLKKFLPHLLQAQSDNLNEADTVQRLVKFFEDVLGYSGLTEISREAQMKNKYVDMALKIDGVTRLLVEAKAGGVVLRDRHIEQAQSYASRNNFTWVILTNGVAWNLYHLTFEEGIEYERAFSIDLAKDDFDSCAYHLCLLHRNSVKKGEHDNFWKEFSALSPASIGRVLFDENVLALLRREIRRREGLLIDVEDLANGIRNLLSPEARELMGPIRLRRRVPKKKEKPVATTEPEQTVEASEPSEERSEDDE